MFIFLTLFLIAKNSFLSVTIIFFAFRFFACLNKVFEFFLAVNKITSKFFLSFDIISTKYFPIEPVEPKIAIFFFHVLD